MRNWRRVFGYSLLGELRAHALFILYGTGRNGKSTLLHVLRSMMGTYAHHAAAATFTDRNDDPQGFQLVALAGARVVTAVETGAGAKLNERLIQAGVALPYPRPSPQTPQGQVEARAAALGVTVTDEMPVFSGPTFEPTSPDTVSHQLSEIGRKAGLGKIGLHTLRHTHATLMLSAGVHPKVVQERLGHSSITVTLDTYSHVMPGIQQAAALAFDSSLRAAPTPVTAREPQPVG